MKLDGIKFNLLQAAHSRLTVTSLRAANLVKLATTHGPLQKEDFDSLAWVDMMLSSIVLLHAAMEDFLRNVGRVVLPECPSGTLDAIPLAGPGESSQLDAKKFLLGALVQYKGSTVNDVIVASIDAYLQRRTFNNSREIASFLASMNIRIDGADALYSAIDEITKRRHQIVHQADVISNNEYKMASLGNSNPVTFFRAPNVVTELCLRVLHAVAPNNRKDGCEQAIRELFKNQSKFDEFEATYKMAASEVKTGLHPMWSGFVKSANNETPSTKDNSTYGNSDSVV